MGSRALADDNRCHIRPDRGRAADLDHTDTKQPTLTGKILQKTRWWTIICAVVISLIFGFTLSLAFAAGFFVTVLWAVAGFWILERLLRAVVVPPGARRNKWVTGGWLGAKLALYALAVWGLFREPFPVMSHVLGLTLLLVVLVVAGIFTGHASAGQPAQRGDDG